MSLSLSQVFSGLRSAHGQTRTPAASDPVYSSLVSVSPASDPVYYSLVLVSAASDPVYSSLVLVFWGPGNSESSQRDFRRGRGRGWGNHRKAGVTEPRPLSNELKC